MTDGDAPSPEFARLVRSALAHFYDYAYLQSHPLGFMLDIRGKLDRMTRAQQVRRVLLECIEALRPDVQDHRRAEAARAHAILTCRYVDGLSIQEVAEELALSRQQVYREHEKGVEAVASLLWDMVRAEAKGDLPASPVASDAGSDRLKIAQAEADRLRQAVHTEFLNLRDLLEGVFRLLAPLMQQTAVQIKMSSPDTWPMIVADRVLVRQALLNVLSYALDVVQGDLVITASYGKGGLLIDIHESPNVNKVQPIAPSAPRRAGVGLAVARRLIEAQGGYLETEKREGRWRAQVLLPASDKTTILIIDDNADMVALFQRYLAGYEVSIVGATEGNRALSLAAELRPQVITLDVMMPHQDGWEILQRLKDSPDTKHIPVIVCSVLNEPQLAFSVGASDYITKPVTQTGLLEVLRRWLGTLQPLA